MVLKSAALERSLAAKMACCLPTRTTFALSTLLLPFVKMLLVVAACLAIGSMSAHGAAPNPLESKDADVVRRAAFQAGQTAVHAGRHAEAAYYFKWAMCTGTDRHDNAAIEKLYRKALAEVPAKWRSYIEGRNARFSELMCREFAQGKYAPRVSLQMPKPHMGTRFVTKALMQNAYHVRFEEDLGDGGIRTWCEPLDVDTFAKWQAALRSGRKLDALAVYLRSDAIERPRSQQQGPLNEAICRWIAVLKAQAAQTVANDPARKMPLKAGVADYMIDMHPDTIELGSTVRRIDYEPNGTMRRHRVEALVPSAPSVASAPTAGQQTAAKDAEAALRAVNAASEAGDAQRTLQLAKAARNLALSAYGEHALPRALFEYRLGKALQRVRMSAAAVEMVGTALAIFESAAELPREYRGDYVELLCGIGAGYLRDAALDRAEACFRKAIRCLSADKGLPDPRLADACIGLGCTMLERAEFGEAERLIEHAIVLIRGQPENKRESLPKAYSSLADLYMKAGAYERAEQYSRQALALRESTLAPGDSAVSESLDGLARVLRHMGRYEEAIALYMRALRPRMKQIGHDPDESIFAPAPALSMVPPERDPSEVATALHLLSSAYSALGKFDEAYACQKKALNLLRDYHGNSALPSFWPHLNNLGWIEMERGNYALAAGYLDQALRATKQVYGLNSPVVANLLATMSLVAARQGSTDYGRKLLIEANCIYEELIKSVQHYGVELQKLSFMESIAGKTDMAIDYFFTFGGRRDLAALHAMETVLLRKGRTQDMVANNLSVARANATPDVQARLDRLQSVRGMMAGIAFHGARNPAEVARYQTLLQEAEGIERDVGRAIDATQILAPNPSLSDLQKRLAPGSALLEYAFFRHFKPGISESARRATPEHCFAFILTPRLYRAAVVWSPREIAPAVAQLRDAMASDVGKSHKAVAQAMYRHLMGPFQDEMRDVRHLIVAPDGPLNLVPFGALMDEDGRYLIESRTVTYVTSGRELYRASSPRQLALTVFANPDYGKPGNGTSRTRGLRFAPLPGTAREARAIAARFPGARIYQGVTASEQALKALKRPAVLHLATHGFFLDHEAGVMGTRGLSKLPRQDAPVSVVDQRANLYRGNPLMKCGLALAGANGGDGTEDGLLTGLEVSALDLAGTKLVVLSACDTAMGSVMNGAAVFGLRRAFTLAGAESLVMSLWPVHDAATADLMNKFYAELALGRSRGEALRTAQLSLMGDLRYAHPSYWGAFILGGCSDAIVGDTRATAVGK
jgi:CHAT domain-containing protein/tetratricopeptide (TPR) repeat protein